MAVVRWSTKQCQLPVKVTLHVDAPVRARVRVLARLGLRGGPCVPSEGCLGPLARLQVRFRWLVVQRGEQTHFYDIMEIDDERYDDMKGEQ